MGTSQKSATHFGVFRANWLPVFILFLSTMARASNSTIVTVSIPPLIGIVRAIADDTTIIQTMVTPGQSPETYNPTPRQMIELAKAEIFFSIGVSFEKAWLQRIGSLNPRMRIFDIAGNIVRRQFGNDHHHQGDRRSDHDPHVWLTPDNIGKMAASVESALSALWPEKADLYAKRLTAYREKIEATQAEINRKRLRWPSRILLVFHPAYGYFADAFGLRQIAVEQEGKTPTAKHLTDLIKNLSDKKITMIVVQPEFDTKMASTIAAQLKLPMVTISSLGEDPLRTLSALAEALTGKAGSP